jgi:protein-tyrosine-phosphatase
MEPSGRNWWHGDDGLRQPVAVRPGKQYVDWDLTDPAAKGQDEVRAIRDEIERVGELPL